MSSLETWPLKPTDFTLVSKDGKIFPRLKACLAENSEYFTVMLSHEFCETTNNQMNVPEYDGVTVASFLAWMYAPKYPEDVMKLKESAQPNEFIIQKQFDVNKFSPGIFIFIFQILLDFLTTYLFKGNIYWKNLNGKVHKVQVCTCFAYIVRHHQICYPTFLTIRAHTEQKRRKNQITFFRIFFCFFFYFNIGKKLQMCICIENA